MNDSRDEREPFVSAAYRDGENEELKRSLDPMPLKAITELYSRENGRRNRHNAKRNAWYYRSRMTQSQRRAYDRMVGSE